MKTTIQIFRAIWKENTGVDKFKYLYNAIVWQIRKKFRHSFIKKIHTGAYINVQPSSSYSPIFYFKWQEKEDQLFIRNHKHLAPTFVDVGANVGIFSALVLDCFKSFYLFEPSPSTFKALKSTCSLNANVQWNLFNVGIADQKGTMDFIDEEGLSGTNRFLGNNIPKAGLSSVISVGVDTLDNIVHEEVGDIVLKVDVEGFEEYVFKGANRIFSKQQAKLVMFERLGRTNLQNLKEFFTSHGYQIFAVQKGGKINTDENVISMPLINLFAAPKHIFVSLT